PHRRGRRPRRRCGRSGAAGGAAGASGGGGGGPGRHPRTGAGRGRRRAGRDLAGGGGRARGPGGGGGGPGGGGGGGGRGGARVARGGLSAAPYLLRQQAWEQAGFLLEQAFLRDDRNPGMVQAVLPLLSRIADATPTPVALGRFGRVLAGVDPAAGERVLREAWE